MCPDERCVPPGPGVSGEHGGSEVRHWPWTDSIPVSVSSSVKWTCSGTQFLGRLVTMTPRWQWGRKRRQSNVRSRRSRKSLTQPPRAAFLSPVICDLQEE